MCVTLLIEQLNFTSANNISWNFVSKDPPEIHPVAPFEMVPYMTTIKSMQPGKYRIHTLINLKALDWL